MPLSVAAACSSKLKDRQKRLRSASPHALLMRAPKGECSTSCMPPPSSKKRSATTVLVDGNAPRAAAPARTYSTACSAPRRSRPHSLMKKDKGIGDPSRFLDSSRIFSRTSATALESSAVRPGASPRQNGIVGAAPWASSTRTRPASTRRIRQEVVPSRNTSPARLSTAKSSSSVPTTVSSGSARTRYCALSGMAPPEVIAASRAPRRPRMTPWTRSL